MRILSLETSAKACSAAVTEDGVLLASAFQCSGLTHSRTLMPMVEVMLKNADMTLSSCDAVAVAVGPGSFTGIRIGTAAVKGFGWARNKPCAGISSLLAMAFDAREEGVLCCSLRARPGESYYAFFHREGDAVIRLTDDAVGRDEEMEAAAARLDCTLRLRDCQRASGAAKAAWAQAQAGRLQTCHEILPAYLRLSQAERMRKERLEQQ